MRILLTNHQMDERAGSELLVTELAEGLAARGHEVAVFTLFPGDFGARWAEQHDIALLEPRSGEALERFAPDVIHVTHWPTLLHLRALGLGAPSVHAFLGVLPALENPPPVVGGGLPVVWGVSEEVAANVAAVPGWPAVGDIEVVRNSIAPGFEGVAAGPAADAEVTRIARVLVVSNHFPPEQLDRLRRVCAETAVELEIAGLPHRSIEITPEVLAAHDAVVSLGRTAIAAASMGIPTLVLDANGADGWLTPANLRRAQEHNYSGRAFALDPGDDDVRGWLTAPPTPGQLREVAAAVRRDHDFDTNLDRIEALLHRVVAERSEPVFGRHVDVVTAYLGTINHQRSLLDVAAAEQRAADIDVARLTMERDDARLHHDNAVAARDEARRDLETMTASTSWRITAPLRRLIDLVRGRGSSRRPS